MRVVFRVDASLKMGTGHVMRCLTLAQVLKENGVNVEFICRQHKGNLINKIVASGFKVHELNLLKEKEDKAEYKSPYYSWLGVTQQQDANECIDILKSLKTSWIIIDHYSLNEDWQIKIKPFCEKIMVIDDLADQKHQCDILLDQTFNRQNSDYSLLVPKSCQLLLGSKYALLRPEFIKWREYSLKNRGKIKLKRLLVSMGGVDIDNMTGQVLKELERFTLPSDINVVVVMGELSPNLEKILAMAKKFPYKIKIKIGVNNMAEIMSRADISIGAAGSTTWERCCLGLPTIQIIVAQNQAFSAKSLAAHNVLKLAKNAKDAVNLLGNSTEWMRNIGNIASKICNGMGVYKVFNKMSDCKITLDKFGEVELCNYVNLNMSDKVFALNMRNNLQVKKWMHNQDNISKKDHLKFIKDLESSVNRRYFLVKQKGNIIGSVSFSKIDFNNSIEFGLYINPLSQSKGLGMIVEAAASHYAFNELGVNKIKLEVFSNNERAVNFYNNCGFELIGIKRVNYQDMLNMEKSNLQ